MKKITAILLALILTINSTLTTGFAQEAPPAPTTPPAPETPVTPENPYAPTPEPTAQPTEAPAATAQPTTAPEKTPHPKAATPKPAATAQVASTPKPAATPIPSITEQQAQAASSPSSAINGQPDYSNSTGGQNAVSQTGDGLVQTGDATVTASVGNDVNTNLLSGNNGNTGSSGTVANSQNGDSSTNNATANSNNSSDTTLSNLADIDNNIGLAAKTGDNTASRNTGDGAVLTGDANVGVTVINGGNNNVQGLSVNQYDVNDNQTGDIILGQSAPTASCGSVNVCQTGILGSDVKNTGNGTDSTNTASTNNNSTSDVAQANTADVTNNVAVDAITGQNNADSNVGAGQVETGDVNVAVTILNFLNNNILAGVIDVINIFDDYSGDIIIPKDQSTAQGPAGNNASGNAASGNNAAGNYVSNSGNGADSTNTAAQDSSLENSITQTNASDIDNNINIKANTGDNRTSSNTNGENSVETGDVNAHAQVYNLTNINSTDGGYVVLINDKGTWRGKVLGADGSEQMQFEVQPDGTVVATNNGNGTGSENNATANAQASETVTQTNTANVSNNVDINADTGNNSASRNTGGGAISTGDVNVGASIMNFVNNNFVGQTFRVLLVNVFGNWTGQVRKEGEQPAPQPENLANASDTSTPAIGGSEQSENQSSGSNQSTVAETAYSAPTQIANSNTNKGKVLGTMTKRNQDSGFSLNLADGRSYYTDDTVQVPASAPLIASIVEENTSGGFNYLWLLSLGLVPVAYVGYKKYQVIRN